MSMAPKDRDIIKEGIAALLGSLIGSAEDTGGSQTAGTVFAKENKILEMLETIYKVSNYQNVASLEASTFGARIEIPYYQKTKPKTLINTVNLERDFYIVSAHMSISNDNNGGHVNGSFEVNLNGSAVFNTSISTKYISSGYYNSAECYYSDIGGGWISVDTISGSIDYSKIPSQKFVLCPKGSILRIYGSGTNSGTTGSSTASCTLRGYYAKE